MKTVAQGALLAAFLGWTGLVVSFLVHVWLSGGAADKAFASALALPLWLLGGVLLSLLADDLG